jgi:hypothetical protein
MTVRKIQSGRVVTLTAEQFIGEKGTIFYNEDTGNLRMSDGLTVGGVPIVGLAGSPGPKGDTGTQINRLIDIPDVNSADLQAGSILVYDGASQWVTTLTIPAQSNIDAGEF